MELGSSLEDYAAVRVVIVPIGRMSEARFDDLAEYVMTHAEISLKALPRANLPPFNSVSMKTKKSVSDSYSNLRTAVTGENLGRPGSDDEADEGAVRVKYECLKPQGPGPITLPPLSDWEEFRASLRIWGAIGILDLVGCSDLDTEADASELFHSAHEEFSTVVREASRSIPVSRCFVFTDALDKPGIKVFNASLEDLRRDSGGEGNTPITFGIVDWSPLSDSDEMHLEEVRVQVIHVIGKILSTLESDLRVQTQRSGPIYSPLDMRQTVDNQSKLRSRRQGRLDKCVGDLYLLMASSARAKASFESAVERTKTTRDTLWLATSLEGLNACAVLQNPTDEEVRQIISRSAEAREIYRKKNLVEFEVASALKLSTYLARHSRLRFESLETLQSLFEALLRPAKKHSSSLTLVAPFSQQMGEQLRPAKKRVAVLRQIVRLTIELGARRKAALVLYQLLGVYQQIRRWREAYEVAMEVIKLLDGNYGVDQMLHAKAEGFATVKRSVYLEAANIALQMLDEKRRSYCLINALALSPHVLSNIGKTDDILMTEITILTDGVPEIKGPPTPPFIRFIHADVSAGAVTVHDRAVVEKAKKSSGPFIFSALRDGSDNNAIDATDWVKGEPVIVQLTFESFLDTIVDVRIIALLVAELSETELNSNGVKPQRETADGPVEDDENDSVFIPLDEEISTSLQVLRTRPQVVRLPAVDEADMPVDCRVGVQCVPLMQTHFRIVGAVVKVFGDSMLRLDLRKKQQRPVVKVVPPLSVLALTFELSKGDRSIPAQGHQIDFHVYNGEAKGLRVIARNTGSANIKDLSLQLTADADTCDLLLMDREVNKFDLASLDINESASFEVKLGTASPREGSGKIECVVEHSIENYEKIFRQTECEITVHTQSALLLRRMEMICLADGMFALTLEVHNAFRTLLRARAQCGVQYEGDNGAGGDADIDEAILDPLADALLIVQLDDVDLQKHFSELKVFLRWDAVATGSCGVISLPLNPSGDLMSLLDRPKLQFSLEVDGLASRKDCICLRQGEFYKLRLLVSGGSNAQDLSRSGTLDIRICQEDGRGRRDTVDSSDKVSILGIDRGILCPAVDSVEHTFGVKFNCPGEFGVEASLSCVSVKFTRFWRLTVLKAEDA